ncbi:MAG: glycosyltransferase family 4 protein [Candidatus Omnitrophica bacterium]|nr:glycosyltransferase family 4 protein [Candidatus Omnitrophota bacterium]
MKILHASHLYYPSLGGNQVHNKELSEALVRHGDDVSVFTSNARNLSQLERFDPQFIPLSKKEVVNGVRIRRYSPHYGVHSFVFGKLGKIRGGHKLRELFLKAAYEMWAHGPCIPQMLLDIYRKKPDIVMAVNNYHTTTYLCYLANKYFKIPLVMTPAFHTQDEWAQSPIIYKMLESADLIICLTEYEKRFLLEKGLNEQKLVVIGVGVDCEKFFVSDANKFRKQFSIADAPVVGYVGRHVMGKGINTLVNAMPQVWEHIPNAKLVLAGHKDERFREVLEKKKVSMGGMYRKNVIEFDEISEDRKKDILAASDVFAMPSNTDSFGIVYLEAWASGTPVIACRDTPQETLINHGQDGLLVGYGDEKELAASIIKLLQDTNARASMGRLGRQKVQNNYRWDIIASRIREEYQKILESNNSCRN